jgi:hypothetical protein
MNTIKVKISAKCAREKFEGCSPDYIRNICHGRCCWTTAPDGTISAGVFVEKDQRRVLRNNGAEFNEIGVMKETSCGHCSMQKADGLCKVHAKLANGIPVKPRRCYISPWTLTTKNTLIIRNRYRRLCCYNAAPAIPAYRAFATGLMELFGDFETFRIVEHFDNGGDDLEANMIAARHALLNHVTAIWGMQRETHSK